MQRSDLWVDGGAHLLHMGGRAFPCDRDVEALCAWQDQALLLSSDTDCLSLWDGEGLVRTARVGVYPQDMAVQGAMAVVCGGADGQVHLLALPELTALADYPVPGMPERVAMWGDSAYLLALLADVEVHTALLRLALSTGDVAELARFAGLPGALEAADSGLWLAVSERVMHWPYGAQAADVVIEGFGLPRRIRVGEDGVLVNDPLEGLTARITHAPRAAVEVLSRGEEARIFSR